MMRQAMRRAASGRAQQWARRHAAATARRAASIDARVVRFAKHGGKPEQVLTLETEKLSTDLGPSDVLVRMEAAPIHPADINRAQGLYGGASGSAPGVGGSEGVGVVQAVGAAVRGLAPEDRVVPARPDLGTWRSHLVAPHDALAKVSSRVGATSGATIPWEYAACMSINPPTALRLLSPDFANLSEGDVILVNGANGALGRTIIQLAAARGLRTIAVVRDRPDEELVVNGLKDLGAHAVVFDSYINTPHYRRLVSDLPAPKLALNATGGYGATELARALGESGTLVTYGGMSRKPVQLATSHFIFKDLTARGFWLSRWAEQASDAEQQAMREEVEALITRESADAQPKLQMWLEHHSLSNWEGALEAHQTPYRERKVVLRLQE